MATYNKRGYKPKTKVEKETEEQDESTTAEVFSSLDEGASRTEEWVAKNQTYIIGTIAAIVVIVLGYLAYVKFVQEPNELEASNEMFQAQQYFNEAVAGSPKADSLYTLALNGGEGKYGFVDIIDNYGGTKAGNLANYYAGMAYLNMKQYQEAIDFLEDFDSDDEILAPLAHGGIGDAFVQLDQLEEGLGYYKEAAEMRENPFTTPRFLHKAGIIALKLEMYGEAEGYFKEIRSKYPDAAEADDIEMFIAQAKAQKGDY
ncbi:MAG: tetratricopeptide repeat protein [Leeuwenhoekiella sp.]